MPVQNVGNLAPWTVDSSISANAPFISGNQPSLFPISSFIQYMNRSQPFALIAILIFSACTSENNDGDRSDASFTTYRDTAFWQEYHEAYPVGNSAADNEVRSIAVDDSRNVWVATAAGIFRKRDGERQWTAMLPEAEQGPSFSVLTDDDNNVWASTWNAVYRFNAGKAERMVGAESPVGVLCKADEGIYALGPRGIWCYDGTGCRKIEYPVARSVRDAITDGNDGLWIATDVGLYHSTPQGTTHVYQPDHLISAYVRGIDLKRNGALWAGGLGGVTIFRGENREKLLPAQGIPSVYVNCVSRGPDDIMWVGTDAGVVRYNSDGSHTLRFSRRWLLSDQVKDIAFDHHGNAWIATAAGVSAIKRKRMTLAGKQQYFYDVLMRRHIREPWIAGQCRLKTPGDTTTWEEDDDDNDGEYTGNYLAMECFRYAATKDPQAKENAAKAFRFLKQLQEVTGTDGFFARTIVPAHWTQVDDNNRTYTERELADALVKEPRFKPVEVRWHKTADGKWMWKGDTSSDEICGHMMGYFFYHELAADAEEKKLITAHVTKIVDHLIAHDFTLTDVDGTHTRWGVWTPSSLNRDPEWMPDCSLNSFELLSFIKLAYHVSGDEKYQQTYLKLIEEEGYLDNAGNIHHQNPAWFIYFDVMLAAYQYPILLKCEKDPKLLAFYEQHIDQWFETRKRDHNPLINFIYNFSRNKNEALASSVGFLVDTPLDLVSWNIDHTIREDVEIVRSPVLDELQVRELPPASIRMTVRWDKNPWAAQGGDPSIEREPVFWLLPYWMGRYLGMIEEEQLK